MKAPSDATLQSWWRRAVKAVHGNRCFLCGDLPTECHHIIKRRVTILRHDHRNGVPLCAQCHHMVELVRPRGKMIWQLDRDYLSSRAAVNFKDYLFLMGQTKAEFFTHQLAELKCVVEEPEKYRRTNERTVDD